MLQKSAGSPLACIVWGALISISCAVYGPVREVSAAEQPVGASQAVVDDLADLWLETAETILTRHVDSPTRQEMLKAAIGAVCKLAQQDPPRRLAARLSQLGGKAELCQLLHETLDELIVKQGTRRQFVAAARTAGLDALLAVAGAGPVVPLSEFGVQQQLRDNRYVGIGIALAMQGEYPTMQKVFPRGPAWNGGARDGDQMVKIDGFDAKKMPLSRVIELLRGQEGKPAKVVVLRPGEDEPYSLTMVRGVVPFDTVEGTQRDKAENWQFRFGEESDRIAYLKFESFRGSTPSELRRIAGQLHTAGFRALMVDLRGTEVGELRYAVMVADALLGAGTIGQVLDERGRQRYESTADQLFSGWPMVVIVDRKTAGQAEWVAAALQDSGLAVLVGQPTAGQGVIVSPVELPHGIGGVQLTSGFLYRHDGQGITVEPDHAAVVGKELQKAASLLTLMLAESTAAAESVSPTGKSSANESTQ